MLSQTCTNCIYAVALEGGSESHLACVNKAGSAGRLRFIDSGGSCRNLRLKNHGRDKPPAAESDDVRFIPLTQGKFAIVDAEDYERLSKYKWYLKNLGYNSYAYRTDNYRKRAMHREIMNAPDGMVVDHIDGNGLNNSKSNLRICTQAQNVYNNRPKLNTSSKYKGVSFNKNEGKWKVTIKCKGEHFHLGWFRDEKKAARAYDKKAAELFGEFAYLNFPKKLGRIETDYEGQFEIPDQYRQSIDS